MQRYFFDISGVVAYLRRSSGFTGIQRTVVMLIDHAARDLDPAQVWISFYSPLQRQYRAIPFSAFAEGALTGAEALRGALGFAGPNAGTAYPALRGYRSRPVKLWFHALRMHLNAAIGNEAHFRRRNTTLQHWKAFRMARTAPLASTGFDALARPDDVLILLDSTVKLAGATDSFLQARRQGLSVLFLVHDLIPIVAPQFCQGTLPLNFHDWLLRTGAYVSVYLANSEATARDLARFLDTYGLTQPIRTVPLAQAGLGVEGRQAAAAVEPQVVEPQVGHLKAEAPGAGDPQATGEPREGGTPLLDLVNRAAYPDLHAGAGISDHVRALTRHPYVLCVGTLEVRKNIWKIAQAWDRLRQLPGAPVPKLVFAGRRGWLIGDFDAMMAATGNLGGWVEIIDGPTDAELGWLYRHCLFTVMASFYEGWGLPIGESLGYGKTAVVSDTSSMPEVGGDLVEYCDPQSIASIEAACARLILDPGHRRALEARIAATRLRGWGDVAADLVRAIREQDAADRTAAGQAGAEQAGAEQAGAERAGAERAEAELAGGERVGAEQAADAYVGQRRGDAA